MAPARSPRAWRALALVGAAIVAVAVLGLVYLGRDLVRPPTGRPVPAPPAGERWGLVLATFGDASHGAVVMSDAHGGDTYVTADGGRTWTQRHVGIAAVSFVDPTHSISVQPGSTPRLETSSDGGRSWAARAPPFPRPVIGLYLNRVTGGPDFVDPENGWWLDAPPPPRTGPISLWRTADGGRTWRTLAAAGLPVDGPFQQPVFADQQRGAVVVRTQTTGAWPTLLTTQDGGSSWRPVTLPEAPAGYFPVPATGAGTDVGPQVLARAGRLVLPLLLGNAFGGFSQWTTASYNGGMTWLPWSRLPSVASPLNTPVADNNGGLLLAAGTELWLSLDEGRTWQQRPLVLPPRAQALAVVSAPAGAVFIAATRPLPAASIDVAVFRSPDAGAHWNEVHLPHSASGVTG